MFSSKGNWYIKGNVLLFSGSPQNSSSVVANDFFVLMLSLTGPYGPSWSLNNPQTWKTYSVSAINPVMVVKLPATFDSENFHFECSSLTLKRIWNWSVSSCGLFQINDTESDFMDSSCGFPGVWNLFWYFNYLSKNSQELIMKYDHIKCIESNYLVIFWKPFLSIIPLKISMHHMNTYSYSYLILKIY